MSIFRGKDVLLLGLKGADGSGVPNGGTTGQVLKKHSNTDGDVEWANESGGGGSGTDSNAVHYTAESKTSSEKQQARENIGAGTYSKPSGGIPANDLDSAVQASLGKADSALQSVPNTYRTSAAQDAIDSGKQSKATTATVTISVADWSGGTICTKSVYGVTSSNIVICDSSDSSVQCTAQGAGTLTFTAESTPSATVLVKVVIIP